MGNPFLLQACLRLPELQMPDSLEIGSSYSFEKEGHRLYQINVPMDLRKSDWTFLARIVVVEYTIGHGKTRGFFIPVKIFSEEECSVISQTFVSDSEVSKVLENKEEK